jgi:hypothetical protein
VSLNGGQITYTPEANYSGATAFDYQVCDNGTTNGSADPKCATATVTITVGGAIYTISGKIIYGITGANQTAQVVSGVNLNASGASVLSAISDSAGNYQLSGLTSGGNYTVVPSKPAQSDVNGINSLDATRIQQRLVGIQTNNIIGQWKFVPVSRQYNAVSGNLSGETYQAILVGEVSGNWSPGANFAAQNEVKEQMLPSDYKNKQIGRFENELGKQISMKMKQSLDARLTGNISMIKTVSDVQEAIIAPAKVAALTGDNIIIPVTIGAAASGSQSNRLIFPFITIGQCCKSILRQAARREH